MKNLLLFLILVLSLEDTISYQIELANLETDNIVNYGVTKLNHGVLFLGLYKKKSNFQHTYNYYFAGIIGKNKFEEVKKIKIKGQRQRHLGCPVFVESSNEVIFPMAANATGGRNTDYGFKLFSGYLNGYEIKDIEPLNFCQPHSNYTSPTVSSDGLTLIFKKDKQLFESKRQTIYENWLKPTLIEELMPLNPIMPRFINDSLLTFSANSNKPVGSDDIYTALRVNDKWMPTRPWEELNSEWSDFGVTMIDSISGFYSSSRNEEWRNLVYMDT